MTQVERHELPLADEEAVRSILDALDWPILPPNILDRKAGDRSVPPEVQAAHIIQPYWEQRLSNRRISFRWHNGSDVWLQADRDAGVLRRVVINDLLDEAEARIIRAEFVKGSGEEDIAELVARTISKRPERAYEHIFRSCLENVRHYFARVDGQVVETEGYLLPISQCGLRVEHVELLRETFRHLPAVISDPTGFTVTPKLGLDPGVCDLCGNTPTSKAPPIRRLKQARKRVADLSAEVADEAFLSWLRLRVNGHAKAGSWTRSAVLYDDYDKWLRCHGDTRAERAEARANVLSKKRWGEFMCRLYARRRDGKGMLYNVRLKRAAST